jgi:dTDP-4-dehydrorhamnose 3,5-epimerase
LAKLALYDPRDDSSTKGLINEFYLGNLNPILVKIPRSVYHGFTSVGNEPATIINFPTHLYNYEKPDEYRLPPNDPSIPYKWDVKMG